MLKRYGIKGDPRKQNFEMSTLDQLTDDELRTLILKKQIEYIKLCQDNFLLFVKAMWPDFI